MVYAVEINQTLFPAAKINSFGVLLNTLLPLAFLFMTLLFMIYMLWGGIEWIRAGNNKESVIKAQSKWRYAILGYVVVMISLFVVKLLGFIANVKFPL